MNLWEVGRKETEKDTEYFEKNIKPILNEFYMITGDDFFVYIEPYRYNGLIVKLKLEFEWGRFLRWEIYDAFEQDNTGDRFDYKFRRSELERAHMDINKTISPLDRRGMAYYDPYNIKVIRAFIQYWDVIKEKMDKLVERTYRISMLKSVEN